MTITPPFHQVARLKEILSAIPRSKRKIGVEKWHQVLGDLRPMALVLLGARCLFSQMKEALCHAKIKMVTLSKVVHEALADFLLLAEDMSKRPTHIYKLVLIRPTMYGYHNASG